MLSFSNNGCLTKVKEPSLPYYLAIATREHMDSCLSQTASHPGFEHWSSILFPTMIAITLSVPP